MSHETDEPTLKEDNDVSGSLQRVSYQPGMLLGLEATQAEQAYHRRRLNRHQYWFQGYGTLMGLKVSAQPATHTNAVDEIRTRLHVSPGVAIDGLGREVIINETYCINIREWVDAQTPEGLLEGYLPADQKLWIAVYIRQKQCDVGKQPVLDAQLNMSTDRVQASRIQDGVGLEIEAQLPTESTVAFQPWAGHRPVTEVADLTLTEQEFLTDTEDENSEAGKLLNLQARLLESPTQPNLDTEYLASELDKHARVLLAHISIDCDDIDNMIVNPRRLAINNLVRPFITTANQLAWLNQQPSSE
jgi:hypothetical protein